MVRIQYRRYGGPSEMHLESFELPALNAGQVRVRVKAASVNPVDWKVRNGMMKLMTGKSFPRGMGTDFSGVVESVGAGVTRLQPGDAVLGAVGVKESGAFAEAVIADEKLLVKKPPSVAFEQAACLPIAGVTAWRALVEKANLKAGQSAFINGCSGGVGQAAVQIGKHLGASVAGSCGPDAIEEARKAGVEPVLDYTVRSASSLERRFDVVFDVAGTLPLGVGRTLLAPKGILLDINPTPSKILRGLLSPGYKMVLGTPTVERLEAVADLAARGKLTFVIGRTAPLESSIALITDQERGKRARGKTVIVVP